jgi:dihydropteroate synthase
MTGMIALDSLAELARKYEAQLHAEVRNFDVAGQTFDFGKQRYLMGVVNLSPDSWYRESVCLTEEQAVRRGQTLAAQGAAIVDVGAESTLLHAERAGAEAQLARLLPVVRRLAERSILVSVETYDAQVARQSFEAGARILNLTGNPESEDLFRCVADHEGGLILCYVQGKTVRDVGDFRFSEDVVGDMRDYFARAAERAERAGVRRIWLDPGLGFYYRNLQDSRRRIRHQMEVFLHTFRLRELGWPTCHALPHAFECFGEEVRTAESFFAVLALLGKTDLLRTHEIPKVRAVLETMERWGA